MKGDPRGLREAVTHILLQSPPPPLLLFTTQGLSVRIPPAKDSSLSGPNPWFPQEETNTEAGHSHHPPDSLCKPQNFRLCDTL